MSHLATANVSPALAQLLTVRFSQLGADGTATVGLDRRFEVCCVRQRCYSHL